MPRDAASINKLRDKVRALEAQASLVPPPVATYKPALTRPCSRVWDWHCECGYLVHAGRMHCPICNTHRSCGATMVGSFRGQMQASPAALHDIRRQMASLQLPSEVMPAMHGRPRGASAQRYLSDTVVQQPLRPGPQRGTKVQTVAPAAAAATAATAPAASATPTVATPPADVDVDPEDGEGTVPEERPAPNGSVNLFEFHGCRIGGRRGYVNKKRVCRSRACSYQRPKPRRSCDWPLPT